MKSRIRQLSRLTLVALLFCTGVIQAFIVFSFIDLFFSKSKASEIRDFIKMVWLRFFGVILGLRVNLKGSLPVEPGFIVANHISWLDIIVIGQYLPAYFVAKSDILGWPVIGYMAKQAGTIFIRRGDKKNILITAEKIVWMLRRPTNIIAFPEGTTTQGNQVLGFHASLFQPAILAKTKVHPVAVRYIGSSEKIAPFIGDDEFIPHLVRMLSLEKIEVELAFLEPIDATDKTRITICNASRASILREMQNGFDVVYASNQTGNSD